MSSDSILCKGSRLNRAFQKCEEAVDHCNAVDVVPNVDANNALVSNEAPLTTDGSLSDDDDDIGEDSSDAADANGCGTGDGSSIDTSLAPLTSLGCLRKPNNRDSVRKSLYQQYMFTKKFKEGEASKNDKQSGKENQIEQNMLTEKSFNFTKEATVLKYTRARFCVYGSPLKRSQIKAYWSKLNNKKGPIHLPTIDKEGQYYDHLTIPELKKYIRSRECTEPCVSRENKTELMFRLAKMDEESGLKFRLSTDGK